MSQSRWYQWFRVVMVLGIFAALAFVMGGVPRSVTAAPTCTTDCYVDPAGSDANDGATALSPLKSIQLAINSVSPAGTVHLAAGSYLENAPAGFRELYINKSLIMLGAGSGQTIIELPMKVNGVEIFGTNLDVTIEGITFTKQASNPNAAGFNLRVAEVPSSFSNLTFRDVESAYASGRNAQLCAGGTFAQVTVEDSNFNHAGYWGFSTAGLVSAMTITNSHFDDNGRIDPSHGIGFDLEGGAGSSNVVISGGTFNNNGDINVNGTKGINIAKSTNVTIDDIESHGNFDGVIIWEWASSTSNVSVSNSSLTANSRGITLGSEGGMTIDGVTITGNDLSDNLNHGVLVFRDPAGWGNGVIKNVVVNRNDLSNNPNGGILSVYPFEQVSGTCNWWGSAAGPGAVNSMVTFDPWLLSSDLNGPCGIQVELTSTDQVVCNGGGVLNVDFSNVIGLYGYEFKVDYEETLVSATGAFVNSWFNTGIGLVPPGWNAQCSGGTCQFAASLQNPTAALNGFGTVAKVNFATLNLGGTFTPNIYDIVLTDIDGMPLAYDASATAPEFAACGVATVKGKVSLQGRASATPLDAGIIKLVNTDDGLPAINATFDDTGNFEVSGIPALPDGSVYNLQAMHILYLGNQTAVTLEPAEVLIVPNTRLLGGDANNGGLNPPLDIPPGHPTAYDTGVNMTDISCIGGSFGLGVGTCGSLPFSSTDINADGGTNIQDLSIAGGNFDKHPFQPW